MVEHIGALVKYNPCTVYARGGKACPYFHVYRTCKKSGTEICKMPEYDLWLKKARDGSMKRFYPKRIKLLENKGTILVLHHNHMKKIIGEATITRATQKGKAWNYWFNRFIFYPSPITPAIIRTDSKLARIWNRGRWKCLYISAATIDEIRELSGLKGESRERLKRELEFAKNELEKMSARQVGSFLIDREIGKLESEDIERRIIEKTKEIFKQARKRKVICYPLKLLLYASLYMSYKSLGIPKRYEEIASIGDVDIRKLQHTVNRLRRETIVECQPTEARSWILRYGRELDIPPKTIQLAEDFAEAGKKVLRGKSPISVAAAALTFACDETGREINKRLVVEKLNISCVTLRNLLRVFKTQKQTRRAQAIP